MSDQQGSKSKRKPPSRAGKGPTPSSWKPGQSGNPAGRPRVGAAFAERVREKVDPDLVIDLALRVATDEQLDPRERLAALWPLIDRGYVKPPAGLDINPSSSDGPDLSNATDEQLRAALALQEKALAVLETPAISRLDSHHVDTPSPADENPEQQPLVADKADA